MSTELTSFPQFLIYTAPNGKVKIDIFLKDENLWLTQKKIAELFGVDRTVITKHLKNIFSDKELSENSVSAIFAHTAEDGKTYQTYFYNLDAILFNRSKQALFCNYRSNCC